MSCSTRNGNEALDIIREMCRQKAGLPQLILLDINLRVMDGFDFLKAFSALDCPGKEATTIVMQTMSLHQQDIDKVKEAGVVGYLNKPLTHQALEDILSNCFKGWS